MADSVMKNDDKTVNNSSVKSLPRTTSNGVVNSKSKYNLPFEGALQALPRKYTLPLAGDLSRKVTPFFREPPHNLREYRMNISEVHHPDYLYKKIDSPVPNASVAANYNYERAMEARRNMLASKFSEFPGKDKALDDRILRTHKFLPVVLPDATKADIDRLRRLYAAGADFSKPVAIIQRAVPGRSYAAYPQYGIKGNGRITEDNSLRYYVHANNPRLYSTASGRYGRIAVLHKHDARYVREHEIGHLLTPVPYYKLYEQDNTIYPQLHSDVNQARNYFNYKPEMLTGLHQWKKHYTRMTGKPRPNSIQDLLRLEASRMIGKAPVLSGDALTGLKYKDSSHYAPNRDINGVLEVINALKKALIDGRISEEEYKDRMDYINMLYLQARNGSPASKAVVS